jgi:uncharacterized protein
MPRGFENTVIFDMKFGRYYHRPVMPEQQMIDSLQFAREAQHLQGSLPVADLPAVAEELFDTRGSLDYSLTGFVDRNGKPGIDIEVRGELALVCQRCMGRLDFELARCSRLLLAKTGEALPPIAADEDEVETVPAESVANVLDVVEQEVLLALPIAPLHSGAQCTVAVEQEQEHFESPFGVLAHLKRVNAPS